jgi:hypothetical protein
VREENAVLDTELTRLPAADEIGRICAVAAHAQRDVQKWAASHGDLFSAKPFDAALYTSVCLCTAFSAPWLGGAELRATNRAALWGFGVDWLIDYVAKSRSDVQRMIERCLAVADGAPPDDDLTRALADIRDDLMATVAFPELRPVWRDELRLFLHGMAREWDWNAARADHPPTFDEYLDNADNLGFSFAFAAHWISTCEEAPSENAIRGIREASHQAQRMLRLINDLGTYQRDVRWGDLNGLMLGVTPGEVRRRIAALDDRFDYLAHPLRAGHSRLIHYMKRQLEFCDGFHETADYWGEL